jgi:hypothetical protein
MSPALRYRESNDALQQTHNPQHRYPPDHPARLIPSFVAQQLARMLARPFRTALRKRRINSALSRVTAVTALRLLLP